jgi:hypothetical protein
MGIEVESGAESEQTRNNHQPAVKPERKKRLAYPAAGFFVSLLVVGAVLIPVGVLVGGSNNKTNKKTKASNPASDAPNYFESTEGPFEVKLSLFSSEIANGYSSLAEAENDFEQIAKFLLNNVINSNGSLPPASTAKEPIFADTAEAPIAAADEVGEASAGTIADVGDATDFETNNQEEDVDKADLVKSDGEFVYAAYGDFLLIWKAETGEIVTRVQMPAIELPENSGEETKPPLKPVDQMPAIELPENSGEETKPPLKPVDLPLDEDAAVMESKSIVGIPGYFYNPKPSIKALLLEGTRLSVVVSGYGYAFRQDLEDRPVVSDYLDTHIRLYDTSNLNEGTLELVSTKDANGSFRNAYTVEGNAHVVTMSSLNTYDYLISPVQRYQPAFSGMTDEEYKVEATRLAEAELIPRFVGRLLADLTVNEDSPDLARISLFAESISGNNEFESEVFSDGVVNALAQIVSFDMTNDSESLGASIAASFLPSSWGYVYATKGMIIVAGQGWTWMEEMSSAGQTTYLVGFQLDGATSTPSLVGSVAGYLLSPYSLDFVDGYLRVATTMNFWSFWSFSEPDTVDGVVKDVEGESTASSEPVDITVGKPPPDAPQVEDEESSTKNQVIILRIPSEINDDEMAVLEEVGRVNLGKPNEVRI